MHRLYLSKVVGEERRDHQLEEHPAAGMEQPQETGKPHPGRCSVGWPNAFCKAGVSGMEHPEPSTNKVRWPCHRPSSKADRCTALPKRSKKRSKKRSGSLARA